MKNCEQHQKKADKLLGSRQLVNLSDEELVYKLNLFTNAMDTLLTEMASRGMLNGYGGSFPVDFIEKGKTTYTFMEDAA